MPTNPLEYMAEQIPASLTIAAARVQEAAVKMRTVQNSGRRVYLPDHYEKLERICAELREMSASQFRINEDMRAESARWLRENRSERSAREAAAEGKS